MTNEKIITRIQALRAKAADSAASHGEIEAALGMIAKLMETHAIEEADLAQKTGFKIEVNQFFSKVSIFKTGNARHKHKIIESLNMIANYCDCDYFYDMHYGSIYFIGDEADAMVASYLTEVIKNAMDADFEEYARVHKGLGYGAKASFHLEMANRVNARLYRMKQERKDVVKTHVTSTSLVPVDVPALKRQAIQQFMSGVKIKVSNSQTKVNNRNAAVREAGRAAGDRVNLNSGITGTSNKAIR